MGSDKALQPVDGVAIALRVARALRAAADPVIVVGPHRELGSEAVLDEGKGPLAAMLAGWERLIALGCGGPVFLAACDLPFLTPDLVLHLADQLGRADAAVPLLGSRAQPISACYAPAALPILRKLIAGGSDSMRSLVDSLQVNLIPEASWGVIAASEALFDVDTLLELQTARQWAESSSRSAGKGTR